MNDESRGVIDLSSSVIELSADHRATPHPAESGPPVRYEGYSIGAPLMTQAPPHDGEMHPDGDEILFLVSGAVTVLLEDDEPAREIALRPSEAVVVPRGVWHKVDLNEPSQLLYLTPGPGGEHRAIRRGVQES